MSLPVLYVFAISHYCEKACWALDHLGIDHRLCHLAPGPHVQVAKGLGAPRSSLPILVAPERGTQRSCIQGSAAIIDWADATTSDTTSRLTPPDARDDCLAIERRVDDVLGVHIRRYYYSEAMVDCPATVRPIFSRDLPVPQKVLLRLIWRFVRVKMIEAMDLGPEQRLESRSIVAAELDWLDGLLSDQRDFLIGERFSRADLAAASLLAPLAAPLEHPTYAHLELPPRLSGEIESWQQRPSLDWVRRIYADYRA